ncbi:MAG: ferrous iron transport protein B [Armatimonadetes bacterium]|nr:ferrous iron transport protein B [Armatimonadota bacterium]
MAFSVPGQDGLSWDDAFIAVVGNPNAGKTTLFNALTGSHQRVANYAGVTVERVSGKLHIGGRNVEIIDVPGLYSLEPVSEDERVAVDVIEGRAEGGRTPSLLVCVIDAGNLERNLYFFSQLCDLRIPAVVALTMTDLVRRNGSDIDLPRLAKLLGVQVVPVVAHRKLGLKELRQAIMDGLEGQRPPERDLGPTNAFEMKVAALSERLARSGFDVPREEVRAALEGKESEFAQSLSEAPELLEAFESARASLEALGKGDAGAEVADRYHWAAMVQRACVHQTGAPKEQGLTDKLDLVLTHKFLGLALFVGVMYVVFQSIYTFAQPLMEGIGWCFDRLGGMLSARLEGVPWLKSLVVDGILMGVGTLLTFLPQICILFLFISILEGTGYLSRAAFMMDRLLGWCGLNGRAFIPLLSSFACAVPGIMAARIMPDKRSRLATILVAPLMSCSARLPVYLVLIGAFIQPAYGSAVAGIALFAMHLLGLFVAVPVVWVLNRGLIKGTKLPFLLELPPYQWPKWRDVWIAVYFRGKVFVQTAGTIIVVMSVIIWALLYFPRSEEATARYRSEFATRRNQTEVSMDAYVEGRMRENSYLGRFGKAIEPAFLPAGFDWRLTTAILSSFPARETMVSGMGILFDVGDAAENEAGLTEALKRASWPDGRPLVTPWTAVGLMVFFALCCQCMSTLAAIRRETNSWKWPVFVFTYMTALAYLGAVLVHQLELRFG